MMQNLIILLIISIMAVSERLKMSWEDKEDDDVVEKMRPGQDLEHMRLAVSFVNQLLSLVCQAEAAQVGDIEFITSSADITNSIKRFEQEQEVDNVVGLNIISKEAIINPVTESMDSGKIKCEYDNPGGEKGSVNITLSVWKMTMEATTDVCENKNGDITVIFEESKQWSVDETNVKNRVQEKIKKDLNITKQLTDVKEKNMFTTILSVNIVKGNSHLRTINDNIKYNGTTIPGSLCFAVDGKWEEWGTWTQCTKSCGGGDTDRTRECVPPTYGGKACSGEAVETKPCNTKECPVDGKWNEWGQWKQCTKSCGGEETDRRRLCVPPTYDGKPCSGRAVDKKPCDNKECPDVAALETQMDIKEGGGNSGLMIGGSVLGALAIVSCLGYLGYAKKKHKMPFKSFRSLYNGEL